MASINKLSVRGVRAFSPDDQEQVIEFYFPVTVIVGSNGCGKTTIIESLKYAVTGSLPPGKNAGQSFVHDPKSIGHQSVKANIKLRLTNRAGQQMVVIRSMELTQKRKAMTFKALDGILRTTDSRTGEKVSLSHKCSELDRQIPMLLGVSKPILEHVVFCHQEDSSWPLQESTVLKTRFDAIFDSTRYAKALKAITDTKKEYSGIVKDLKAELAGLAAHKQAAKGFREELEQFEEDLEVLETNLQGTNDEIKQVNEEIQRNRAIAQEVEEQRLIIEDKETELAKEISVLDAHRNMLPEDLTTKHNAHQLKDMLRDFDARMTTQLEKRRDLQRDMQAAEAALKSIAQEDRNLREQIGNLQAQKSAHEERLERRLKHMDAMAKAHEINLPVTQTGTQNTSFTSTQHSLANESMTTITGGTQETMLTVTPEDMQIFFKAVNEREADLKGDLASRRKANQQEIDKIQEDLNKISAEVTGVDNEHKKLESELNDIRSEVSTIASQAPGQGVRVRQSDIDSLRAKAADYAKQRDQATNDKDLKEIPAQIRAKEGQIDMLKREIEDDNLALRELRQNTDAQNSITVLKEQAVSELESLKEALKDNAFLLNKLNLTAPTLPDETDERGDDILDVVEAFSNAISDKNETIQQELNTAKDDLASKERVVSEKSALLSHTKNNLVSLRSKLDSLGGENGPVGKFQRAVAAIRQYEQNTGTTPILEGDDPQQVMAHISARLEDIEKASRATIQPEMLGNLLDQLYKMSAVMEGDEQKIVCPCCTRDFEGLDDVQTFRDNLERMKDIETSELLRANKQGIEKSRAAKAEFQNWRNVVSETMSGVVDWNRMTTEAKDAEVAIRGIEQDLTADTNELDAAKETVSDLQRDADEMRDLHDASKRWMEDTSRLARKKMEIYQKKADLSVSTNTFTDRDLETVEADLAKRQAEKDSLNNQIIQLNKNMTKLNNNIALLSQQATNIEKMANDKQKKFESEQQSSIRKKKLQARQAEINEELPKIKSKLLKLKQTMRTKDGDLKRSRKSAEDELETLSSKLRKFESDVSSLHQIQSEIDDYLDSNKEEDLNRITDKISSLSHRSDVKNAEIDKIKPELEKLNKRIEDQASQEKLIKENLKMIQMKDRICKLEAAVSEAKADVEKVEGFDKYERALHGCQKKLQELSNKQAHSEGRRGGLIEQIRSLKRKLKSEDYNDIDERHRIVVIKHETTQIAVSDLEKYHSALDNALLRYHGIKIEEINRIIRELWNLTYKGEDITNIELVSGQESGARKSYNYRVVMSKGNTKLDMRGRCSAGQRVLAAIVIRMALAETFCVNFGCIALDEPTVNLDFNNKNGLAIALAQIISSRAQQSNFQLIVITHDEEFVSMMKAELASQSGFSMPEKYFQVRREEAADGKYYSKIDAIDWDELV